MLNGIDTKVARSVRKVFGTCRVPEHWPWTGFAVFSRSSDPSATTVVLFFHLPYLVTVDVNLSLNYKLPQTASSYARNTGSAVGAAHLKTPGTASQEGRKASHSSRSPQCNVSDLWTLDALQVSGSPLCGISVGLVTLKHTNETRGWIKHLGVISWCHFKSTETSTQYKSLSCLYNQMASQSKWFRKIWNFWSKQHCSHSVTLLS